MYKIIGYLFLCLITIINFLNCFNFSCLFMKKAT